MKISNRNERLLATTSHRISKVRLVNTTDIDVARPVFRSVFAESSLEPEPSEDFGWTMDLISCEMIKLTVGHCSGVVRITAPDVEERPYILALSGGAVGEWEVGSTRHEVMPHRMGAVLSPNMRVKFTTAAGFLGRNILIEGGALKSHLTALTGRAPDAPITFDVPLDLAARPGAALYGVAQLLRREMDQPDPSLLMVAALRDALLTSLVAGVKHSASGLLDPAPLRIGPGYVKRAEEYIEAHVTEPITLTQIAAAAGVPARSLRAAFTARHGIAPMEFLRRMRFELARCRFIDALPGTTVMGVVQALGLGEPGRFSVEYKKRFGQSPSQTLAGGRAGAGLIALRAAF